MCKTICNLRQIDPVDVDVLLFSCRSQLGKQPNIAKVTPKLVAKI